MHKCRINSSYHGEDWQPNINCLHQFRQWKIPITNSSIQWRSPAVAQDFAGRSKSWNHYNRCYKCCVPFQLCDLLFIIKSIVSLRAWILKQRLKIEFTKNKKKKKQKQKQKTKRTCKLVEVLKIETVLPVQTSNFLTSFENTGGEETKLFPPLIIFSFNHSGGVTERSCNGSIWTATRFTSIQPHKNENLKTNIPSRQQSNQEYVTKKKLQIKYYNPKKKKIPKYIWVISNPVWNSKQRWEESWVWALDESKFERKMYPWKLKVVFCSLWKCVVSGPFKRKISHSAGRGARVLGLRHRGLIRRVPSHQNVSRYIKSDEILLVNLFPHVFVGKLPLFNINGF